MKRQKYYFLTILIPIVFAVLFLWSSVKAQPPAPPTREQIILEIQSYAQRHAESDTQMQTQFVVDLYRDNSVGLTPPEIALIYEENYTLVLNNKNNDPWKQLRPNIGWVVAVILLIVLALGETFKKKISDLLNSVWENIYKNLAGSRVLRRIAILHYKKALLGKYQKLKIPFRPDHPLDMRTVFVPLQVTGSSGALNIDVYQALLNNKRMMVIGAPGSGKSMLMKHVILSYAEDHLVNIPEAPIPVLLELHRFNDPAISVENLIADEFSRNDFPKAENFALNNLKAGRLLLLFDGLDEVNTLERKRVVQIISDFLDRFDKCRSIITCRSIVYKGEFNDVLEKTFEIIEFSDQQIRRYLQSWEHEMAHRGKSIEQLMLTLQARPRIMALARNPLMLTVITYLYTDTDFVLPQSRAEFYRKATDILLDIWHNEQNHYRASDKRQVLQQLALFNQGRGRSQEDRRSIEFQAVISQVKNIMPHLNLNPEKDARALIDEIVERSGLLLAIDGGEQYQFAHLTLQEYFAAAELKNDPGSLVEKFSTDIDSWRETIKIWCGLDVDSTQLVQKVYDLDKITAFECLADAQKIDQKVAESIISNFKDRLGTKDQREAVVRAFASVASDNRPRGAAVLMFLGETLQFDADSDRRSASIEILSLTNLSEAASILIKSYDGNSEIRTALVRMGDLAAEKLAPLAEAGSIMAMEDLQSIGTPRAANALVPLLWSKDEGISLNAAWHLTGLLHQPNVEKVVNESHSTESFKNVETIDWVWKPFDVSSSSNMYIVVGRISKLLTEMPVESKFTTKRNLDPRIVVPLCTILMKNDLNLKLDITSEIKDRLKNKLGGNKEFEKFLNRLSDQDFPSFRTTGYVINFLLGGLQRNDVRSITSEDKNLLKDEIEYVLQQVGTSRYLSLMDGVSFQDKIAILKTMSYRTPTSTDWLNIFNPIEYDFEKGWHLRVVWIVLGLLSLVTTFLMGFNLLLVPPLTSANVAFFILGSLLIFASWVIIWRPKLLDKSIVNDPFEAIYLFLAVLGPIVVPFMIIYGLAYLLYVPVARAFGKKVELDIAEYLKVLILFALLGGLMTLIAYFVTKALLVLFVMYVVVVVWLIVFLVCVGLLLWGFKLHRISHNPLRGIISSEGSSELNTGFWFPPQWRFLNRKLKTR